MFSVTGVKVLEAGGYTAAIRDSKEDIVGEATYWSDLPLKQRLSTWGAFDVLSYRVSQYAKNRPLADYRFVLMHSRDEFSKWAAREWQTEHPILTVGMSRHHARDQWLHQQAMSKLVYTHVSKLLLQICFYNFATHEFTVHPPHVLNTNQQTIAIYKQLAYHSKCLFVNDLPMDEVVEFWRLAYTAHVACAQHMGASTVYTSGSALPAFNLE